MQETSIVQAESNHVIKNWKFYEPEGQMERTELEGQMEYAFIAYDDSIIKDTQSKMKRKYEPGKTKKEILKKRKGMRSPTKNPNDIWTEDKLAE